VGTGREGGTAFPLTGIHHAGRARKKTRMTETITPRRFAWDLPPDITKN